MLPQIKTKLLENDFYTVKDINNTMSEISYIDMTYTSATSTSPAIVTPNIFKKLIKLHKLEISISKYVNMFDIQDVHNIYSIIKKEIDNEFFKKATELGDKNRFDAPIDRLDIDIDKIKTECEGNREKMSRFVMSKCINSSNIIAVNGRIGNAHWISSNRKTYNYLINYFDSFSYDGKKINIGNIQFNINDSVDDDILLIGRKNSIDQPGVHCFVLTDEDGYILFNEYITVGDPFNKTYIIYYAIEDIGTQVETQYLKLKTRSISYYRRKKLEKIKALYGL